MFICFVALALLSVVTATLYGAPPAQEQPYGVPPAQEQPTYPPLRHVRVWLDPVPGYRPHHHHHGHGFYPGFPVGWPYPYYGWDVLSNPFYDGRHHHRGPRRHRHSHSRHDSRRGCDSRDSRDC